MIDLTGRTALISGGSRGIGRATVGLFAESGWKVVGVDRAAFGDGFPASAPTDEA